MEEKEYWVDDNGVKRKMTPEEIVELKQLQAEIPPSTPSLEDEVQKQEQEIEDLKAALNALLEKKVQ